LFKKKHPNKNTSPIFVSLSNLALLQFILSNLWRVPNTLFRQFQSPKMADDHRVDCLGWYSFGKLSTDPPVGDWDPGGQGGRYKNQYLHEGL